MRQAVRLAAGLGRRAGRQGSCVVTPPAAVPSAASANAAFVPHPPSLSSPHPLSLCFPRLVQNAEVQPLTVEGDVLRLTRFALINPL